MAKCTAQPPEQIISTLSDVTLAYKIVSCNSVMTEYHSAFIQTHGRLTYIIGRKTVIDTPVFVYNDLSIAIDNMETLYTNLRLLVVAVDRIEHAPSTVLRHIWSYVDIMNFWRDYESSSSYSFSSRSGGMRTPYGSYIATGWIVPLLDITDYLVKHRTIE